MSFYDIIGIVGVALILAAYAGTQLDRMDHKGWAALAMNFMGAVLILVSMIKAFNLSAALMEGAWALVALYGMARKLIGNSKA